MFRGLGGKVAQWERHLLPDVCGLRVLRIVSVDVCSENRLHLPGLSFYHTFWVLVTLMKLKTEMCICHT